MNLKNLFTFLFIVVVYYFSNAQTLTAESAKAMAGPNFGIKAGLNFSNQKIKQEFPEGDFSLNTKTYTSFHVGFFAEFILSEKVAFQPEVLYSQEGSKIDLEIGAFDGVGRLEFNQKITYIKVPALLKVKPFSERFSLLAGPQFGFIVKEEIDLEVSDGSFDLLDSAFKSFELSASLGAEYAVAENLNIGGRYNLGISDISDVSGSSLRGNTLQFYISYKLF